MTQRPGLAAPGSGVCPVPRRGMVLAAATLGFGVIQLDVSVMNVAVKPIGAAAGARRPRDRPRCCLAVRPARPASRREKEETHGELSTNSPGRG